LGKAQVFSNLSRDFHYVAVSGLGQPNLGYNNQEIIDECKENIRICAGVGARALQDNVRPK
jgi:aminopeptidase